jgi:hypothetical protein
MPLQVKIYCFSRNALPKILNEFTTKINLKSYHSCVFCLNKLAVWDVWVAE